MQRKRVSREAPMNLDQQKKKPSQTRDPGAQRQQQQQKRSREGKREESVRACVRDAERKGTEVEKS